MDKIKRKMTKKPYVAKHIRDAPKLVRDDTEMWYGEHKGKVLEDVPARYLLNLYKHKDNGSVPDSLLVYIEDCMEVLIAQNENRL